MSNDRPDAAPAKAPPDPNTPPPALLEFMMQGWKLAPRKAPALIKNGAVFLARRRALSKLFPGDALIVPTGHERRRANDTVYRFRPGSDFYYLTGNQEPDCVLVLMPKEGGGHTDVLFVEPNPGHTDATFFTDRAKGELWVGPRLGVEQSRERFGADECRGLPDLDAGLEKLRLGTAPWRLVRNVSEKLDAAMPDRGEPDQQLAIALSELRLLKDSLELRELSAAIAATKRGIEDVIRALKTAKTERDIEGVFNHRARAEGNDVGYNTIAACGANACILHWGRNDGAMKKGELLLLDAGIEGTSLYTADITRSLPVSGRFSEAQREIYSLVVDAQAAAFDAIRPGADFLDPHRAATHVLAHGLELLKILPCSAVEALKEENQFYKRYSLHNTSHMLGLDVHDCAQARPEAYKQGKLKEGMVFTVEPGLYFQLDDQTVPARYRGIGIRVEDDVLVTAKGYKILSKDIPRGPDEVEAWVAKVWKSKR